MLSISKEVRDLLGKPGALSEKFLMWRFLLNTSLSDALHEIMTELTTVGAEDYNYDKLRSTTWIMSASREELMAFRHGAMMMADLIYRVFFKNFPGDEEEMVRNVEQGLRVEERIRDLLDVGSRLPEGGFRRGEPKENR
jgi:hypothetical protein